MEIRAHEPPKGSSDRTFGLVFAAFLLVVALLPLWTRFGLLLHRITSPLALGIVFYGSADNPAAAARQAFPSPCRIARGTPT